MAKLKQHLLEVFLSFLLFILIISAYQQFLADKHYPFTLVGDTNISFLTEGQAIQAVQAVFNKRVEAKLPFEWSQGSFEVDLATSSAILDYSILNSHFEIRSKSAWDKIKKQLQALIIPDIIYPQINLKIDKQLDLIASVVDKPPQNAQLIFTETPASEDTASDNIQIKEDIAGVALDKNRVKQEVASFLLSGSYNSQLSLKIIPPKVTTAHVIRAKEALQNVAQNPIKLVFKQTSWTIDAKQLLTLLDLTQGQSLLDRKKADIYLGSIAPQIDREVQEGLFEFNPLTKKVSSFRPSQEGQKLDVEKTYQLLTEALASQGEALEVVLPVNIIKPKIATSDVNSLGIKELLGRGISHFAGSIPNRIYNINLTAAKINGILVPPGQVFSFNQTVGDITAETGFKQAYVIKEGRTVLDDGGGVCQDSTTLFRAVLNAGLPVVRRTAHAYRVGYYEQGFPPGLDATVFYPSVDFQFKNDTGAHILIQAYTAGTTLYVDLYGTSDGREVALTQPVVTNQTPPPPDLRQDDPTLPKGTVKQVDWAAWGAIVTFKRTVTKNGKTIINETWKSNYKPWQAVYLVGTQ